MVEVRGYKRPPIQEAVIDFRLGAPALFSEIEKAARRIKNGYAFSEDETETNFTFSTAPKTDIQVEQKPLGFKLSSDDRTALCLSRVSGLACSRLAPYAGWDELFNRTKRDWGVFRRFVTAPKVQRIGIRYINRIDVPAKGGQSIELSDFIKTLPTTPSSGLGAISQYTLQVIRPLLRDNCSVVINSTVTPSPLVDHLSLVLDLDFSCADHVPSNEEEMWALVQRMREYKNELFESCITDKARRIFEQ